MYHKKMKRMFYLVTFSFIFCFLSTSLGVAISSLTSPIFPGQVYPTGKNPSSIAVGNFNSDGEFDLAVANSDSGSISILMGKKSKEDEKGNKIFGGFESKADYTMGGKIGFIVVGAFNGDGKDDLVVINVNGDTGLITTLLGNGDGTFTQASRNYDIGNGSVFIASTDLNGDGKPDLVMGNRLYSDKSILILLGNGDGTFSPRNDYPTQQGLSSIVFGDFNKDGRVDLAASNSISNSISILLGNGDGTFQQPTRNYPVGMNPISLVAGDFDKDGKLDIAIAYHTDPGLLSIFLGNGDGTFFKPKPDYPIGIYLQSIAIGDFNIDGKLDLAVASRDTYSIFVLLGNGDGTFQLKGNYTTGDSPRFIAIQDFNNDGKPDLTVTNSNDNSISILIGNGDGSFQPNGHTDTSMDNPSFVTAGDFNGDQKLDLAVANYKPTSGISIWIGDNQGSFTKLGSNIQVGEYPSSISVGDFNGDEKLDLAVANRGSNSISILFGDGKGIFTKSSPDFPVGIAPTFIKVEDFNGDEKLDLAIVNSGDSTVSILIGEGNGTFQSTSHSVGNQPQSITIGDFNGDKKLDLAVTTSDNYAISVLLGKEDGGFQPPVNYGVFTGYADSITTGDFNGDGKLDLATASEQSNSISILLGNGDGTFVLNDHYDTGQHPKSITVGDFNGDGKLDLATANGYSKSVSILPGNGDGSFRPRFDYLSGGSSSSLISGYFNGDKKLDLVVTNQGSNSVVALLNTRDIIPGMIQWSAARYTIKKSDNVFTLMANRIDGADGAVTINYTTSDGTALAGKDYTATSGTLTWEDGDSTDKTVTIPLLNNGTANVDKTIHLTLSDPTNGSELGAQAMAVVLIPKLDTGRVDPSGSAGNGGSGGCMLVGSVGRTWYGYLLFLMGIGFLFLRRRGLRNKDRMSDFQTVQFS